MDLLKRFAEPVPIPEPIPATREQRYAAARYLVDALVHKAGFSRKAAVRAIAALQDAGVELSVPAVRLR